MCSRCRLGREHLAPSKESSDAGVPVAMRAERCDRLDALRAERRVLGAQAQPYGVAVGDQARREAGLRLAAVRLARPAGVRARVGEVELRAWGKDGWKPR